MPHGVDLEQNGLLRARWLGLYVHQGLLRMVRNPSIPGNDRDELLLLRRGMACDVDGLRIVVGLHLERVPWHAH